MVMSEFSNDLAYNFALFFELQDPSWYLVLCSLYHLSAFADCTLFKSSI
ncbi:hypothetical protein SAMN00777080_4821 [Aquiflexum balticum DSM 16537]|uniref:Uncharacterized protein n=1 Tax=Aquiflexum balticum DSM 16537 TaxID=758820 RepID=A0A1W2HBH6_9BACT|nr:hypothetical protein SAMN00777080_4821 [Aquiflexum balticum DSM 16537]